MQSAMTHGLNKTLCESIAPGWRSNRGTIHNICYSDVETSRLFSSFEPISMIHNYIVTMGITHALNMIW